MPAGHVTLCAVDGSTTSDLHWQIESAPGDVFQVVISIGVNDALGNIDVLSKQDSSTTKALSLLRKRIGQYESAYIHAIESMLALRRKTAICTIYNGNLDPPQDGLARMLLMMFNDVILRCGFERSLPIIDLRFICCEKSDYANPIEPSGSGGR